MDTIESAQSPAEVVGAFLRSAPVDLHGMVQALGIDLAYEDLQFDISGKISRTPLGYLITINSRDGENRQRFTIAHEIAHYVLHRDLIGSGIVDNVMYRSAGLSDEVERQANRYAADLLMPAALIRSYFKMGRRAIADLSHLFQVSPEAMRIRLNDLRLGA